MDLEETQTTKIFPGHTPLLWILFPLIAGYLLGILGAPPLDLRLTALGGILLILVGLSQTRRSPPFQIIRWGPPFLLGLTLLSWTYWDHRTPDPLPGHRYPPREATLSFEIDRLFGDQNPERPFSGVGRVTQAPFLLQEIEGQRLFFSLWPNQHGPAIAPGAVIQGKGRLQVLPSREPIEGFEGFLIRSGIAYRFDSGQVTGVVQKAPGWQRWAINRNQGFQATLQMGADSERQQRLAGITEAMLLGRKAAMDRSQRISFMQTGTMHLFAISGLHIGVIAAALAGVFRLLRLPARLGTVIGLAVVGTYVLIVGYPPSAVRAFVMIAFFWSAATFARKPSALSAWAGSAILVLLIQPQELLRAGFQLSYAVVGGLLIYGVPLARWSAERLQPYRWIPEASRTLRQRWLAGSVRWLLMSGAISATATLFSSPLTVSIFELLTPGGILLNLVMIPLASVAIVGGALSLVFGLLNLQILVVLINHLVWLILLTLEGLVLMAVNIPGMFFHLTWPGPLWVVLSLGCLFLGFLGLLQLPRFRPWFFAVPPLLLVLILWLGAR